MKAIVQWRHNAEAMRAALRNSALKFMEPHLREAIKAWPALSTKYVWTGDAFDHELNDEFCKALRSSTKEDMSPLAAYLDSEKPLGPRERKRLAQCLSKGRRMGRPQNSQLRAAASLAWRFYARLRDVNKKRGTKDRGFSDDMKSYAARAMVEDWFTLNREGDEWTNDEREAFIVRVRELMEKPTSRRDPGKLGTVSFTLIGKWENPRK